MPPQNSQPAPNHLKCTDFANCQHVPHRMTEVGLRQWVWLVGLVGQGGKRRGHLEQALLAAALDIRPVPLELVGTHPAPLAAPVDTRPARLGEADN